MRDSSVKFQSQEKKQPRSHTIRRQGQSRTRQAFRLTRSSSTIMAMSASFGPSFYVPASPVTETARCNCATIVDQNQPPIEVYSCADSAQLHRLLHMIISMAITQQQQMSKALVNSNLSTLSSIRHRHQFIHQ
jgi:hypothetical protein